MTRPLDTLLSCPVPFESDDIVQLAHGGGGRKMANLIEQLFLPALGNPELNRLADGAVVEVGGQRLAMSTDTFVVQPPFFPGGNIGSLAIHGTANDLAMCGAAALGFSVGLVLEEGFPLAQLRQVVSALAAASAGLHAPVLTGDTKVVERGKGDGIYINTTGIGLVQPAVNVGPQCAQLGDAILVSGPVGDHGIAVMAARSGIDIETSLVSDSAAVWPIVRALLAAVPQTHVLRDPTRGGLATALCEIAAASQVGMRIDAAAVPVRREVRSACELLGFDPLYVACEGRFLAIVPAAAAAAALAAMRGATGGAASVAIGEVVGDAPGRVLLRTGMGSHRRLERLSGEQLPRIC
jgi:hydrogenase expression/formation protein HypE